MSLVLEHIYRDAGMSLFQTVGASSSPFIGRRREIDDLTFVMNRAPVGGRVHRLYGAGFGGGE
jgi:hypothetical protein